MENDFLYALKYNYFCKAQNQPIQLKNLQNIENDDNEDHINLNQSSENDVWIDLLKNQNDNYQNVKKQKQIENYALIPMSPQQSQTINLFTGLFITSDGIIRLSSSLDQVSFGYFQQQVNKVEEIYKLNVVDISFTRDKYYYQNQFEQALTFLSHSTNVQYDQVYQIIQRMKILMEYMNVLAIKIPDQVLIQREEQYQKYIWFCFNYIQKYIKQYPNQMFKYTIERINLKLKDPEKTHSGFSKSYMELIGLETAFLNQIIHRNQRIDLIKDKLDISMQSIQGLQYLEQDLIEYTITSRIVTFDGFPLKLIQKQKSIDLGFHPQPIISPQDCNEYSLIITEMDVDLQDLEQLILYRQRIVNNPDNLSIDDYLRKELSFLFEDVEYSVQSQAFIHKFYANNIQKLQDLQQEKTNPSNQCSYRYIIQ